MDTRARELCTFGDKLFSSRAALMSLWQEIAENFYPERADFITPHTLGKDFNAHLTESYPVLARRELANAFSAMLRPRGRPWFHLTTGREEIDEDTQVAKWLEYAGEVQRRAIYDPKAKFIRATKEGDHDFATFGGCVISVEEAPDRDHLLFRDWHLRDCTWLENEIGEIDHLHRNMPMTARNMKRRFGEDKLAQPVKDACRDAPDKEFKIRHIVMPSDEYDYGGTDSKKGKKRLPFVSLYVDVENHIVLKEGGLPDFMYVVPRWHTVSGSPYPFSPATTIGLPDARLIQAMARVIIEAGEKTVDPPMVATQEAIRSDINVYAGGVTYIEAEYDERNGKAIEVLEMGKNVGIGLEMKQDMRQMIADAFYLNKITLPAPGSADMTAYETQERIAEYVRSALPLFEPMETEYNSPLMEKAFSLLMGAQTFDYQEMPDKLKGADVTFKFESPIQAAADRARVAQFGEVMQLIGGDPASPGGKMLNMDAALRDAIRGTGAPADWLADEEQVDAVKEQEGQINELRNAAGMVADGAGVAGAVADSTMKLQQAGMI